MLVNAENLIGQPVASIRLAGQVGEVIGILINPNKLSVAAFWVKVGNRKDNQLLLFEDIREINLNRIIIDDLHNLSDPDELTRLKEILKIDYQIPGKKVAGKRRLGQATGFTFDPLNGQIMTIFGKPTFGKRWNQSQFSVHRRQITEVNDQEIKIDDGPQKVSLTNRAPAPD